MKKCVKCKIDKNLEEFNKNSTKKDGYQTICRECSNINSKKYYHANPKKHRKLVNDRKVKITEWLNQKKSTLKCEKCGEPHIACIQFHHLKSKDKDFSIGHAIYHGFSIKKIESEISKCQVLCANCHFKLHWEERQ
jgi:hypothetical protein